MTRMTKKIVGIALGSLLFIPCALGCGNKDKMVQETTWQPQQQASTVQSKRDPASTEPGFVEANVPSDIRGLRPAAVPNI